MSMIRTLLTSPITKSRLALLLLTAIVYLLTLSPSASFWDCSEFIAAAHVLGIPHPPGSPFFVLLGRFADIFFFWAGPTAYRINLLSALSSWIGVWLSFEITQQILRKWTLDDTVRGALGFLAGCLVAFGSTYWFNATEAEVYGVSMALLLTGVWAILRWENEEDPRARARWLLLFVYASFVGMGVHTNSLIPFLPGWIYIGIRLGFLRASRWLWIILGWGAFLFAILIANPLWYGNTLFLGIAAASLSALLVISYIKKAWSGILFWLLGLFLFSVVFITGPFLVGLGIAIVGLSLAVLGQSLRKRPFASTSFSISQALGILLMAALGFSTQIYLPIRAQANPIMNENDPSTWPALRDALERKQYGSMGMIERALYRRAEFSHQVGFGERTGYLGYHLDQWISAPLGAQRTISISEAMDLDALAGLQVTHRLVGEFMLVAVLFAFAAYRRRPQAALLWALFTCTTVGLIFYVNFADGTKPDSLDASVWQKRMRELSTQLSATNLPALPDANTIREEIGRWRSTGTTTPLIQDLMEWEKAASAHGSHLPLPPGPVHREVRERDYFYTPAFVFFGILVALALAALVEVYPRPWLRRTVLIACGILGIVPIVSGYLGHDRSQDWVPREFALDMLESVPHNGVLFTFGDNDTFPLWYLQMAEGIRTDVLVVNTSLAQMDWYQNQLLAQRPDLKMSQTVAARSLNAYHVTRSPIMTINGSTGYLSGDSLWRPGMIDQFMAEIITLNWPHVAICFTNNAGNDRMPGGRDKANIWLPTTGLVRELGVNPTLADSLLIQRTAYDYHYNGFANGHWKFQESTVHTAMNYAYLANIANQRATKSADRARLRQILDLLK